MKLNILKEIGLSEGEIKVYNALLELGVSSLNKIHEKAGLQRRSIYDILNRLIERGLVTYTTENKKRIFNLSHPNKILGYIEEKKHELNKIQEDIEIELPSIIQKFKLKKFKINAEVYRGTNGIKAIYEDMLNYKEHYYLGGGRYVMKNLPNFWENFNLRRIKAKIKFYNLIRSDIKGEIKALQYEQIKVLPPAFDGNPNVIFIWGDKVANVLFMDEFFAFVIENKEIAENYKKYFRYIWKNIAKVY
jgi:sugar-specific transcriptional regulator TrmB